jgi:hypothetical protein
MVIVYSATKGMPAMTLAIAHDYAANPRLIRRGCCLQ